jgi:glucokinase
MDSGARLLGDVGGTNARFAWQAAAGAPLTRKAQYPCAEHTSLKAVVDHYLADQGGLKPCSAAIGIANPITGDRVQMTNHHWSFSIAELQRQLALKRLLVINDFTALALSLTALDPADLQAVGGGAAWVGGPLAVLGPGTGLGVSGLLPAGQGGSVAINGEGGHVTLAAADRHEAAVVEWLHGRFGHASAERALSGPGLVNLYEAACHLDGRPADTLAPAEVISRALGGNDRQTQLALDLFCSFLGSVAGNLALTLGARGGVYIAGGIVPRILPLLARSRFRERFAAKGRFHDYLAAIPTWVIVARASPALLGAAQALDEADRALRP